MLASDLAESYTGVTTGNLNKAVSRNSGRFPEDFAFRLTKKEFNDLIFQFGTSGSCGAVENCHGLSPSTALPCYPVFEESR